MYSLFDNKSSNRTFVFLALAGIWILMVFLVNPIGDFPLNDDWAYARPVSRKYLYIA